MLQTRVSSVLSDRHASSPSHLIGGVVRLAAVLCIAGILQGASSAQTNITQTINPTYNNLTSGYAIPNDFVGLSFETATLQSGNYNVSGYFFSPSNTQLITLFQQIGIKNLRIGGDSLPSYWPDSTTMPTSFPDIDALFGFAQAAGVHIIYSVPNTLKGSRSLDADPTNESYDAGIVDHILRSYRTLVHSFAIGNEEDLNHTPPTLSNYIGTYWYPIQNYIPMHARSGSLFSGPDAGHYDGGGSYSGSLCEGSVETVYWASGFAYCAQQLSPTTTTTWSSFTTATTHYYVGRTACGTKTCRSAAQSTAEMLSSAWVTGQLPGTVPCNPSGSTCAYYPFNYFYPTMLAPIATYGYPYRLTELNEYDGGTLGASNAFTGALFALDIMHWFALTNAEGTNFHNYQWIPTDTIIPGTLTAYLQRNVNTGFTCTSSNCKNWLVSPKGFGIKAFDMGGHGYTVAASGSIPATKIICSDPVCPMPDSGSVDTYAVGSGQDLYVTLVNKTDATNSGDTASVTVNIDTGDAPFVAASVATLLLWNGDTSAPSDPTQAQPPTPLTAYTPASLGCDPTSSLYTYSSGCGAIVNNAQWAGEWTPQPAMTTGSEPISVPPAQAVVVHFHAPSNYVGPIQIDQNGALEMAISNSSGNIYHQWQLAADLNTEPNSLVTDWSSLSNFSGRTGSPAGDIAEAKNLDNSLTVFVPTSGGDVFYTQQSAPNNGQWGAWTDMGSSSAGLSHLKVGQNADGSLTVFGLDNSGNLWYATENAPRAAWSNWTKLSGKTIDPGYVVGDNLNGRLEVFGENGGNVYHLWQTSTNGWSSWAELATGETLNGWLQVARDVSGALHIFALDSSGNVWTNYQSSPSGGWRSTWTELPISGLLTSSPAGIQPGFVAAQNANGCFELFGVQNDHHVYHVWNEPDSGCSTSTWSSDWQDSSLNSNFPNGGFDPHLMVSNTNDGRLQIFAVAASSPNDLWTNWQGSISGGWTDWDDFGGGTSGYVFDPGQP